MTGRRIALLLPLLMAIAVPVGVATLWFRPSTLPAPAAPPVNRPKVAPPPAPAGSTPEAPEPEPVPSTKPEATSWIRLRLEPSEPVEHRDFMALVFKADGRTEVHEEYTNVDRFDLGPLTPGRKGVLVFSPWGEMAPVSGYAELQEREDVEMVLKPAKSFPVQGVVVNALGEGIPGVDLEFSVFLPFERPLLPSGSTSSGGFAGGGSRGVVGRGTSSYSFGTFVEARGIRLFQSRKSEENGRFSLPLYSKDTAVVLGLRKGTQLLKEEPILPSMSPLRLIVPGQVEAGAADPPK
jgi:hypothetical protein